MQRVLFIRRQRQGGLASLSTNVAKALEAWGVEAVIDDADEHIPNETNWLANRAVKKWMTDAVKGFDVVHAWGYRSAWACSDVLYVRSPWVYTVNDYPKTVASPLIDRLNAARCGICSSRAVQETLQAAEAMNVQYIPAGVSVMPELDRDAVRAELGIPPDALVVLFLGRNTPEHGVAELVEAFPEVVASVRSAVLLAVTDENPLDRPFVIWRPSLDPRTAYAAADLVLVPGENRGTSMVMLEAMAAKKCVLARRSPALSEYGMEGASLSMYGDDERLAPRIIQLLWEPDLRQSLGYSAHVWVHEQATIDETARRYAQLYRDLG